MISIPFLIADALGLSNVINTLLSEVKVLAPLIILGMIMFVGACYCVGRARGHEFNLWEKAIGACMLLFASAWASALFTGFGFTIL